MAYKKYLWLIALILVVAACATKNPKTDIEPAFSADSIAGILKYPFKIKTIKVSEDIDLAYSEIGASNKTPLLFVHGLGSYMRAWDKNVVEISKTRKCLRIDLPGYGKSSKGQYRGDMSFNAGIIKAFCNKLGLKKIIIVGHSMGGQIAMTTALLYPELVEKIVLIDPAGFETFTDLQKTTLKNFTKPNGIKASTDSQIRQNLAANFFKMPDDAQFMADDRINMKKASDFDAYCYVVAQNVYGMLDEPVFTQLDKITMPSLCFYGKNDALIPNKFMNPTLNTEGVGKSGSSKMKNCQLKMLDEAGHFAMWEKATDINREILGFVD